MQFIAAVMRFVCILIASSLMLAGHARSETEADVTAKEDLTGRAAVHGHIKVIFQNSSKIILKYKAGAVVSGGH